MARKKKSVKDEIYPSKLERSNVRKTRYVRPKKRRYGRKSYPYRKKEYFWQRLSLNDTFILINVIVYFLLVLLIMSEGGITEDF